MNFIINFKNLFLIFINLKKLLLFLLQIIIFLKTTSTYIFIEIPSFYLLSSLIKTILLL